MTEPTPVSARTKRAGRRLAVAVAATVVLSALLASAAAADLPTADDPRVGLSPGLTDAGVAELGVELLANRPKPAGFFSATAPGSISFAN